MRSCPNCNKVCCPRCGGELDLKGVKYISHKGSKSRKCTVSSFVRSVIVDREPELCVDCRAKGVTPESLVAQSVVAPEEITPVTAAA